jgi:hypothetical protein
MIPRLRARVWTRDLPGGCDNLSAFGSASGSGGLVTGSANSDFAFTLRRTQRPPPRAVALGLRCRSFAPRGEGLA